MRSYRISVVAVTAGAALALIAPLAGAPASASTLGNAVASRQAHARFRPLPLVPARVRREVARPASYVRIKVHRLRGAAMRPAGQRTRLRSATAAATTPTAPFTECPAVGADTSCGILVQVTDSSNNIIGDPTQGPFDGIEDTLIGVLNSSSDSIGSLQLSSDTALFGFDGDGLCTQVPAPGGCPFGSTGYEGPGTSFSGITPDQTGGVVDFSPPLAPGQSAYFSLEEPLSATMVTAGGPSAGEQGGPVNLSENPTTCSVASPVNCATGVFWHQFTDFAIPGRGVALNFARTYSSSQASVDGPLGFGWTDSYNMSLALDASGDATITQEDGSTVTFVPNGAGGFAAPPRVLATLAANPDGSYTFVRDRGQTEYNFSSSGQLTSEVDLNGYQTDLSYNGSGQLTTVTDPSGRTLAFTYSGSHIATVTDPMGRAWSFSYDGSGNLASATDPMGRAWSFTYDSGHLLLTMTDPRGGVTTNVYNGSGQVTSQTDPAGRTTTWSYSGDPTSTAGGSTSVTDPAGNVTTYDYANLELQSVTRAAGTALAATTSYAYDPATLGVTSVTDPNGNVTTSTYDASGNLLSTTDPLGDTTSYSYDSFNQVTDKTSPLGETTSYGYDASGNLLTVTDPLGNTTSYAFGDPAHPGDITSVTDPDGNVTSYTYDSFGDLASASTSPSSGVTDTTGYAYDADGERTCMASPDATNASVTCSPGGSPPVAGTTATAYNADGEVTSITDPDGHATSIGYDAGGNQVKVTDPAGNVTGYAYNADNQQTKVSRPDGTTTSSGYDADGRLTAQANGAGQATSYGYDALGQTVSVTDPLGRTTHYGYDAAGNRTTVTDPAGRVTTYSYDAANHITGISYSDGTTPTVSYAYDADGQRTSMTDGTGTTSYSYDSDQRLTSVTNGAGGTVSYGFDAAGLLTGLTYPNGQTVSRGYDGARRLISVGDWLGNTTTFGYDASGNLTTESYPNGVTSTSGYDKANQLMSITDKNGSATLASFSYTRNSLGQVLSETDSGAITGTRSYSYTQLSQVASAGGGSYGYDQAGNLTAQPGSITQSYDAAGQLTSLTEPATVRPPAPDKVVSANETVKGAKITSKAVTTTSANELILAFVSAAGPAKAAQSITSVSGGGLTWKLSSRSDAKQGTAEVWQAHASTVLAAVKFTAKLKVKGYDGAITIATFTGARAAVGAHAAASGATGAPAVKLTTTGPDSLVWAAGEDPVKAASRTPAAGQTIVHQLLDTAGKSTEWAQSAPAVPAAGTAVTISDTAPATDKWNMAAVEIMAVPATGTQTVNYGYDKLGDRVSAAVSGGPATTLSYDQAGRLTGYGASASYAYDGDGLRMSKKVGATTTKFGWDQSGGVPLLIAAGSTSYLYGPAGQPVEQVTGGTPTYLLDDQQRSTRLLTSAAGTVAGTYSYGPYGTASHTGSASTALRYDGQYTDAESGFSYLRARYYDPVSGQFISVDQALSLTGSPYGFAQGDPVNFGDPTGLSWYNPFSWSGSTWTAIGIGAAFVGVGLVTFGAGDVVLGTVGLSYEAVTADTFIYAEVSADITAADVASGVGTVATWGGLARSAADTYSDCLGGGDRAACGPDITGIGLDMLGDQLIDKFVPEGVYKFLAQEAAGDLSLGYDAFKEWLVEQIKDQSPCVR